MKLDISITNWKSIKVFNTLEKRFNKIHNNTYDYSKSIYINWKTPLIIICTKHGDFEKTPNEHLNGSGCLKCKYEQRELLSKTKSLNKERIKSINSK